MAESSPNVLSMFETFRDELDQHHDRRERLIKTSRDITALSKKIIFSLQRFVSQPSRLYLSFILSPR
ncbi:Putative Translin-associated protein X [Aspergillus calidoustus]|uniref:Putative Translin-associated protein X n=1 Tax=Aspergillus calidoustus TaxID=454130 RepID=A0A0U5CBE1_ASPCI|nr:Putative Translin-associated protein X [Aspergillus calidoustus]